MLKTACAGAVQSSTHPRNALLLACPLDPRDVYRAYGTTILVRKSLDDELNSECEQLEQPEVGQLVRLQAGPQILMMNWGLRVGLAQPVSWALLAGSTVDSPDLFGRVAPARVKALPDGKGSLGPPFGDFHPLY